MVAMSKRDRTLKEILDLILYENPSTQDEIAEKLEKLMENIDEVMSAKQRFINMARD